MLPYPERLRAAQQHTGAVLCVGLDPDPDRLPGGLSHRPLVEGIRTFLFEIVEATADHAAAFKPNLAFFEVYGADGWTLLHDIVRHVRAVAPHALVIADAKRGDLGNTARFYARALFDTLGADAVTVAPYMGRDSVTPFLEHAGRAAYVLCRTSNAGADDFQHLPTASGPLFEAVARAVAVWDAATEGTAGLVAGATRPEALAVVREAAPALPLLVPGVGAQGGDARAVLEAVGTAGVLVNSSRAILYASDTVDFAQAARDASARHADVLRL